MRTKFETMEGEMAVAEMIASGATRNEVNAYIRDVIGVHPSHVTEFYRNAIKHMLPEDDAFNDYKKAVQQQNFNRLEKIVSDTIDGDGSDKRVAIDAIKELNKMSGAYDDKNSVVIAQDGDKQIIEIDFNK